MIWIAPSEKDTANSTPVVALTCPRFVEVSFAAQLAKSQSQAQRGAVIRLPFSA